MPAITFTRQYRVMGLISTWGTFILGVAYAITLSLGLAALKSPNDPISDPFFSLMEILIILIMPFMVMDTLVIYAYASPEKKAVSLAAIAWMVIATAITTSLHFVILTVSRPLAASGLVNSAMFFSFNWPSVVYALDILAWDIFFALSMLFAAPVFKHGKLEKSIRVLMIISGGLSLAGLIGIPLADMQIRLIGVVGYAAFPPVLFLLMAFVFQRSETV